MLILILAYFHIALAAKIQRNLAMNDSEFLSYKISLLWALMGSISGLCIMLSRIAFSILSLNEKPIFIVTPGRRYFS
jgi:hypothetical protein